MPEMNKLAEGYTKSAYPGIRKTFAGLPVPVLGGSPVAAHTNMIAPEKNLKARSLLIARSPSACFLDCLIAGTAADKQKGHDTFDRGSNNKTQRD
jgi:hypothetical protein